MIIAQRTSFMWIVFAFFATLATLFAASCPSYAIDKKDIQKIADAFQKGNNAQATKLAQAEAKTLEELADAMHFFRPPNKGGLGKTDGNVIAAIAEIMLAKPPAKNAKAWNGWAKDLRAEGLKLAKGQNVAAKIEGICLQCHTAFKE
jgi:hypothetical protein